MVLRIPRDVERMHAGLSVPLPGPAAAGISLGALRMDATGQRMQRLPVHCHARLVAIAAGDIQRAHRIAGRRVVVQQSGFVVRSAAPGVLSPRSSWRTPISSKSLRNGETGGKGLGLRIARNIAHAQGGDVRLRNHPDGGLEASLTLPWQRAPGSSATA